MGLTNWSGNIITSSDAKIAKNYLEELELKRLELLVEQFLSFAELRSWMGFSFSMKKRASSTPARYRTRRWRHLCCVSRIPSALAFRAA
jgi:hypothetical protein